jgi:glucose-6-phosphate-specific signal transduction histidine kinase
MLKLLVIVIVVYLSRHWFKKHWRKLLLAIGLVLAAMLLEMLLVWSKGGV